MCTMKCPRCGQLATKAKPEDRFICGHCGWELEETAQVGPRQAMKGMHSRGYNDPLSCIDSR